jgi:predicted nucleotidyltransferase component of viral defense system
MMTSTQITRRADQEAVGARTVERDYVQAHVLAGIAALDDERLVFKGGTALRFCYLDDFRFSADLDFSVVGASADEGRELIASALGDTRNSLSFPVLQLNEADPPRIEYVGPLARQRTIKLDLADDELVIDTEKALLRMRWADVDDGHAICAYTPLEIAAEKIRCVIQRLQCRDLLDLDQLFGTLDVPPDEAAHRYVVKARHRGLEPSIFRERYLERLGEYKRRWEVELAEHAADVPHFDGVERRVTRSLRAASLL